MRSLAARLRGGMVAAMTIPMLVVGGVDRAVAQDGAWVTKASMPTCRGEIGTGVVNGIVYAVGGTGFCSGFSIGVNTVEAYDPLHDTWATKASMPTGRTGPGVGSVGGILYAVGGRPFGLLSTNVVEAYDPLTDTWSTKASMLTAREAPGVGVVGGTLYTVGGIDIFFSPLNTVEAYDPATDTWTPRPSMLTAREAPGVGVVGGILYVVGGYNGSYLNTMEAYDPTTNTWAPKAPMPTARSALSVGVVNGILYAVGGFDGSSSLSTVEAYDPTSDTWTPMTPMPTARNGLGVGVVNGSLYAVGGFQLPQGARLSTNEAFTPVVPFAAFNATVDILPCANKFAVWGTFTLGAAGAFNLSTDAVTVQLGSAAITIPGGSFQSYFGISLFFHVLNGVPVEGVIVPFGNNRYWYEFGAANILNLPTANPVPVSLTIGNNTGSTTVAASFLTCEDETRDHR